MSKIVNKWWFTQGKITFGIVKTIDENTGEEKFRIGLASGFDEDLDAENIRDWGARFYPKEIE